MKYIAYGSNMVQEQMAYRCPDAKLIGTGNIPRARLEFYLYSPVKYTRRNADRVPVAVWDINAADEASLDRYEGYPNYYIKREWSVHMDDGSKIKGMIYLMKIIRSRPPAMEYYYGICNAYRELGLGSEIKTVLEPALKRSLERTALAE